ncbi:hypothetical protein M9H77_22315 [Catharanthus roseus]|uniref:Uncharacterized protein n=1 Tax=Catharanthus roseus TaxID=4058 RepID=A0ACC0ARC0_CATRO|nr:hypothetical protein M9H77_22315 [Catharanthus roseus]
MEEMHTPFYSNLSSSSHFLSQNTTVKSPPVMTQCGLGSDNCLTKDGHVIDNPECNAHRKLLQGIWRLTFTAKTAIKLTLPSSRGKVFGCTSPMLILEIYVAYNAETFMQLYCTCQQMDKVSSQTSKLSSNLIPLFIDEILEDIPLTPRTVKGTSLTRICTDLYPFLTRIRTRISGKVW